MTFASFSMERRLRARRRTRPGPYSKISESRPDATRGPGACSTSSLYLILANLLMIRSELEIENPFRIGNAPGSVSQDRVKERTSPGRPAEIAPGRRFRLLR